MNLGAMSWTLERHTSFGDGALSTGQALNVMGLLVANISKRFDSP